MSWLKAQPRYTQRWWKNRRSASEPKHRMSDFAGLSLVNREHSLSVFDVVRCRPACRQIREEPLYGLEQMAYSAVGSSAGLPESHVFSRQLTDRGAAHQSHRPLEFRPHQA